MDSYTALVLSHMLIALPVVVWVMSSYFETVPLEMEESAMVDGATRQRALLHYPAAVCAGHSNSHNTQPYFSRNNFMFSQVLSMEKTEPCL